MLDISEALGGIRPTLRVPSLSERVAGQIVREGRNTRVIRTLTSDDIVELYEMWTILEAEATAMACQTATAIEQSRIAEIMAAMEGAQDRASYHHLNLEFHRSLVAPCRNRRL